MVEKQNIPIRCQIEQDLADNLARIQMELDLLCLAIHNLTLNNPCYCAELQYLNYSKPPARSGSRLFISEGATGRNMKVQTNGRNIQRKQQVK